jgi:hypothetical protein
LGRRSPRRCAHHHPRYRAVGELRGGAQQLRQNPPVFHVFHPAQASR